MVLDSLPKLYARFGYRWDPDWERKAYCRRDPKLWTTDGAKARRAALHGCTHHCRVRNQCRDTGMRLARDDRRVTIYGGIAYDAKGKLIMSAWPNDTCEECSR